MGRVLFVILFFFFCTFIILNISCHSHLVCRVSAEKSADNLIAIPLYLLLSPCCFYSLFVFNFNQFDVFLLSFILYGNLCASWSWATLSFPTLGNFSAMTPSNIFSGPFSFLLLGPL